MIQSLGLAVQGAKPTEGREFAIVWLPSTWFFQHFAGRPPACWVLWRVCFHAPSAFLKRLCDAQGGWGEGRGTTPTRVCSLHVGFIPAENIYREGAMIQKATALLHLRRSLRRSQHNSWTGGVWKLMKELRRRFPNESAFSSREMQCLWNVWLHRYCFCSYCLQNEIISFN